LPFKHHFTSRNRHFSPDLFDASKAPLTQDGNFAEKIGSWRRQQSEMH
jgi:hypothetical protein